MSGFVVGLQSVVILGAQILAPNFLGFESSYHAVYLEPQTSVTWFC